MSRSLAAELKFCLIRPLCTSAARAAVCSSVRRERSVFPFTVMTPRGPGLEFQISIVWHRIESSKCSSSEQCVIATAEGDDIEDQVFASEVVRGSEDEFQCD